MAGERMRRGESLTRRSLRRLLRRRIAVACITLITLFYVTGVFAPLIAPHGYAQQDLDHSFEGPSMSRPLGTDRLGRDTLSRDIFAARTTTIVTAATVATGFVLLPVVLGMLAGYVGGWIDAGVNRVGEILASMPGLPMLVLINATLRPRFVRWVENLGDFVHWQGISDSGFADYFLIFGVLSLFGWVGGARLIRSQVLTLRGSEFILAARASGAAA